MKKSFLKNKVDGSLSCVIIDGRHSSLTILNSKDTRHTIFISHVEADIKAHLIRTDLDHCTPEEFRCMLNSLDTCFGLTYREILQQLNRIKIF